MKLTIQKFGPAEHYLIFADGEQVGQSRTAPEAMKAIETIAHRVNCFEELRDALQTLLNAVEGKHITVGDCNQALAALERANSI